MKIALLSRRILWLENLLGYKRRVFVRDLFAGITGICSDAHIRQCRGETAHRSGQHGVRVFKALNGST